VTLEEEKKKLREELGLPEDSPIFTKGEWDAYKKAEQTTAVGAAATAAAMEVIPGAGGAGALAAYRKYVSPVITKVVPGGKGKALDVAGTFGSMIVGNIATRLAQHKGEELVRDEAALQSSRLLREARRKRFPKSYLAGEFLGGGAGAGVKPTFSTLKGAGEYIKMAGGIRGKYNKEVVQHALANVGIGGGLGVGFEGVRQWHEGDIDPVTLLEAGVLGATITKPFAHGKRIYGVTGDPVTRKKAAELEAETKVEYGYHEKRFEPEAWKGLSEEQAYLESESFRQRIPTDERARLVAEKQYQEVREKDLLEMMVEREKVNADEAKVRRTSEEATKTSAEKAKKELKESAGLDDPKIAKALKKFEPTAKQQEKLIKQAKEKIRYEIASMSNDDLMKSLRRVRSVTGKSEALRYIEESGMTHEEARIALAADVESRLPPEMFTSAKNLASKLGITLRIAVNRLTTDSLKGVMGYAPRTGRNVVLSLDDLNMNLPFHEITHVFVRDMVESSNSTDRGLMKGWLNDLYSGDPKIKKLKEGFSTQGRKLSDKEAANELFVTESSERLAERIRTLPKDKFNKMRRWFSDVRRGMKVRWGKQAVNDVLDYFAQRMELDVNLLLDNDLHARHAETFVQFLESSEFKADTQLDFGIKPTASHKGTLTVDGEKYTSSASAYEVPKEVAELFDIPEMPKDFAKKFVNNLNRMKAAVVKNKQFSSDLEYIESLSLMENSTDYPADFRNLMKIMEGRNTGVIKKVFKALENVEPIDIVFHTRRPESSVGSYDRNEISIGVPTIDDSFDVTLAQYLINRRLLDNPVVMDELTSVWGRLMQSRNWFNVYEPYMVENFLDYALKDVGRIPEKTKQILAHYHEHLKVGEVPLYQTHHRTPATDANFSKYSTRMMHQGNVLQDVMRNLPDDVRLEFATKMVRKDGIGWASTDDFLTNFDSMLNLFGIDGSLVRKDFDNLARSPELILRSFLDKRTFSVLDDLNVVYDKVKNSRYRDPSEQENLEHLLGELWTSNKIPVEESLFTQKSALDAFTQKAEEALGVKGLKPILERVIDTPVLPRGVKQVDFSLVDRTIAEISGESPIMKIDHDTSAPFDPTPKEFSAMPKRQQDIIDREHRIRHKPLKDFKVKEPLTWQPLKRVSRSFRPVIDRIREVGRTEQAQEYTKFIADLSQATLTDHNKLLGRFLEKMMLLHSEVKLNLDEFNMLGDYQFQRWRKHLKLIDDIDPELKVRYNENPRIRYFDKIIENIYRDTRQYQNDIGLKVEVFRGEKSFLTEGAHTREYTAEIINQPVRRVLMKGEKDSPEYQALKNEAIEYWESLAKKLKPDEVEDSLASVDLADAKTTRQKFERMFAGMAEGLSATESTIGSQRYKALRVATGKMGIPPSWVERNAIQRLTRYVVRFAKDAAFFKNIESNEKARRILGIPDQEGNYLDLNLPGLENGGPFNIRNVIDGKIVRPKGKNYSMPVQSKHETLDALMNGYIGYYQSWDLWTRTFNRAVTSSWLGVGAGIRDWFSSYLFALPYMRLQDYPILVTHLLGFRNAWIKSYTMGVNKTSLGRLEFPDQSASEISDAINKVADVALTVGGRSILEKTTRALQFAFGRQLVWTNLRLRPLDKILPNGDWTADRFLRKLMQHMGQPTVAGRKVSLFDYVGKKNSDIPEELLNQASAAWVEMNQGTYDVRGLPRFTQRGLPSMFTSLARWSIEKSDRMLKDTWMPLRAEYDPLPLLKATLGAMLGGEAIKYISEEIANKLQSDPKFIEAVQMDNAKEQAYAVLTSIQVAGFFGYQTSLLRDLYRATRFGVSEGIPGGFTFPAIDALETIAADFFHIFSSGEALSEGWSAAWMKFMRNTIMGLNQTARYTFQHLMLSDEMSDFNARAQYSKFRRLERGLDRPGVPSGISNEYASPARRAFKHANSVSEARRLLPAAMNEAAKKAMQKFPNSPRDQAVDFDKRWRDLYNIQWTATPALPTTTEYRRHVERMRYLGIKPSAGDLRKFPGLRTEEPTIKPGMPLLGELGVKTVSDVPGVKMLPGGEMMPGTIISKRRSKDLIKLEKEFLRLKDIKKRMILRFVYSKGMVI
jgi:hypothetical protein